ncbi:MAG: hypothetical protein SGPRY_009619 [Prymnesium sp.]
MLQSTQASRLVDLPRMKELLEAMVPYTERHFERIDRLVQASHFLSYTLASMRILLPPADSSLDETAEARQGPAQMKAMGKATQKEEVGKATPKEGVGTSTQESGDGELREAQERENGVEGRDRPALKRKARASQVGGEGQMALTEDGKKKKKMRVTQTVEIISDLKPSATSSNGSSKAKKKKKTAQGERDAVSSKPSAASRNGPAAAKKKKITMGQGKDEDAKSPASSSIGPAAAKKKGRAMGV